MKTVNRKDFTIGEASVRSGLSVKQIRYLEERNYINKIPRIVCGLREYRVFTEKDILPLRRIKQYLDKGFSLNEACKRALKRFARTKRK